MCVCVCVCVCVCFRRGRKVGGTGEGHAEEMTSSKVLNMKLFDVFIWKRHWDADSEMRLEMWVGKRVSEPALNTKLAIVCRQWGTVNHFEIKKEIIIIIFNKIILDGLEGMETGERKEKIRKFFL